ncbi:MAG: hypothetical protein N4A33_13535 [Bacteriovoracaceae bacterium]|jgi:hypothetical protein|nr:hypothetical protein [Bacteriovoracaceae bacterium]
MKKLLIGLLILGSTFSFGKDKLSRQYKIEGLTDTIKIEIDINGNVQLVNNPNGIYTLSSNLNGVELDNVIYWINDGSPELARFTIKKKNQKLVIDNSYIVYNDGEPSLHRDNLKLKIVQEK